MSDAKPTDAPSDVDEGVIEEPENSTVDDWRGQRIERDTARAEQIADEEDDPEEAAERFADEAEGPPPEDLPDEERRT